MRRKVLMKGNEAIGEAAIRAGCKGYFGYPITPQSELPEYMSRRFPEAGGTFLQAESELAAINMVYGAAGAGIRVMTSSSSPGISLKQEGISMLAGAELPAVIVNMMRGGPGIGGIQPSQADYYQATRGGGHGDYRVLVLAPSSVQELVDLTWEAFALADQYRNPVLILGDGMMGQMMEPVILPDFETTEVAKPWATTGMKGGRGPNLIHTLHLPADELEEHCHTLFAKYQQIAEQEKRATEYFTDDAEILVVAYGIVSRVARAAVEQARENGIKAGLFRPVTLWPYPDAALLKASRTAKKVLTVEVSMGQMVEDVRLTINGRLPVEFYGRIGQVPTPNEILDKIKQMAAAAEVA